jgi:carboxyvinyl-carboxyphosphonate phosphorylmutase
MPLATFAERRARYRALLESETVSVPGSVFDPVSARLAQASGYKCGLMGGSVTSSVVLGAPDIVLLTLSDFVEQARRIARACDLPLMVDADHGYGNPLNVRRTVEDLEAAGVAALTIEDTVLPRRHGGPAGELITRDEFGAKLRAALDARSEASLVIIGRTGGITRGGIDEAVARARICAEGGVDAIFATGVRSIDEVEALSAAVKLPLLLNALPVPEERLVANRVRIAMQGHLPYYVALKALYDSYQFLLGGGSPEELRSRALPAELQATALAEDEYARQAREYLEG